MRQKISMICPTRERTKMLDRFVKNIFDKGTDNIKNKDYFELLLIVDNDDEQTRNFFAENLSEYPTIKMINRERSEFFNRDYINFGASKTSGDLIWGVADDVELSTDNWDAVLLDKVNKFESYVNKGYLANVFYDWTPWEMAYLINTDCSDGDFERYDFCRCSFPILTREAFNKLGIFVPHEWKSWGADYGLGEIFRRAGRVLSLPEIKVAHMTWNNNNKVFFREKDSTNETTEKRSSECDMVGAIVPKEEDVINKYLEILTDETYGCLYLDSGHTSKKDHSSRISFEVFENPLGTLRLEIQSIEKIFNEVLQEASIVPVQCPKCKFVDFDPRTFPHGTRDRWLKAATPPCATHGPLEWNTLSPANDDKYCKEYKMLLSCNVEGCDVVHDLTGQMLSCPIPTCDYKGLFNFEVYKMVDARYKAKNLHTRLNSLKQKHNDTVKLLRTATTRPMS